MNRKWLEKFDAVCREMPRTVERWKAKTGAKAVGWMLTDVPEELILAAGALPVAVLAEGVTLGEADKYFQGFACSYSRSVLDLLASGRLAFLDGVIIPYICDTTRALDLVVKHHRFLPWTECLRIPKTVVGEGVLPYYRRELERLADRLAVLTGNRPNPEQLRRAIQTMNQVKSRLQRIRALLREKPGAISAAEYLGAVRASLSLPKEEALLLLDEFLADATVRTQAPGRLPRVVLAGKVAEPPAVVEMIEAAGLRVVEDALVLGGRYLETTVAEPGDPWANLAQAQLGRWPMTGVWDSRKSRGDFLLERVRAAQAQGVIFLVQKFCEPWEIDYPGLKEVLDRAGIKNLRLETEYQMSALEPLRTRVEAFAEMLSS